MRTMGAHRLRRRPRWVAGVRAYMDTVTAVAAVVSVVAWAGLLAWAVFAHGTC